MFCTPVVFSSRARVALDPSVKTGGWLARVLPVPDGDQSLAPSSLRARTCTS